MADITDPTAVAFCNENVRVAANQLAQAYNNATAIVAQWTALGGASFIANEPLDEVIDGAQNDGRPVINGADVNNIINRLAEIITDFEAGGSAKLNTILQVAPHPQS